MAAEARQLAADGLRMTVGDVRAYIAKVDAAGIADDVVAGPIMKPGTRLAGLVSPPPWLPSGVSQAQAAQQGSGT